MNTDNLKPFTKGDERTRELAKKGGKKSGEARRKRKNMRDTMNIFLSMPMGKGKAKDIETIKSIADLKGINMTMQDALVYSLMMTALGGGKDGTAAFKVIQETIDSVNDNLGFDYSLFDDMSQEEIIALANMDIDLEDDENEE